MIAEEAGAESQLWAEALRADPEHEPVFSPLAEERWAPRLFAPPDRHTALLLGDYLYAHGLVRIAEHGEVEAVADLAALISVCAQLRAEGAPGDGEAWAATASWLGQAPLATGRVAAGEAVDRSLAVHAGRVG